LKRLLFAGLLTLSCALACPAGAQTLVVDRAVLLIRHGVRPPTHEPALPVAIAPDAWPAWPVPDGNLTPHGAQAIAHLAAFDRLLFAQDGLLPATGCPDIAIHADIDERTIKTGEAFAAGFAPGCNVPVGHVAAGRDPLFSALDAPEDFDAEAAKRAMVAAAGGNPAGLVGAHPVLFQAMQAALAPGGHAYLDVPTAIISKRPGQLPRLSGPLALGSSGAEDFLLEYLDDKPMQDVAWGRLDRAGIARLLALHPLAYTLTARPAYIADRGASALADRIESALESGPKLTVLVGHDTNQALLAGMLGLHWSLGGYPADDPPPGGGMLFLLSHDARGTPYVTLIYQVQTMDQIRNLDVLTMANRPAMAALPIAFCGHRAAPTACTLAGFTRMIARTKTRVIAR
jgi:4-phytase/acid phosphatase